MRNRLGVGVLCVLLSLTVRAGERLAFDGGGKQLAVSGNKALTIWDLELGRPAQWFPASKAGPVYFSRTNRPVWLEHSRLHQGTQTLELQATTLHPDGRELVVDGEWRTLAGLQPVDPRVALETDERVVALSPDFAALQGKGQVRLVDRRTGQSTRLEQGPRREHLAISPDQGWLAREAAERGYVEILELPSLKVRFRLGRHAGYITGLAWRPDSAQLAVADLDGVKLWNLRDGQLEQRLDRRLSAAVSYSPDGRFLAQGLSTDASVCLWDLSKSRLIATLASYGPEWVVLAPDGRFEASSKADAYLMHVERSKRTADLLPRLLDE
jgi:WD40 repeat protein